MWHHHEYAVSPNGIAAIKAPAMSVRPYERRILAHILGFRRAIVDETTVSGLLCGCRGRIARVQTGDRRRDDGQGPGRAGVRRVGARAAHLVHYDLPASPWQPGRWSRSWPATRRRAAIRRKLPPCRPASELAAGLAVWPGFTAAVDEAAPPSTPYSGHRCAIPRPMVRHAGTIGWDCAGYREISAAVVSYGPARGHHRIGQARYATMREWRTGKQDTADGTGMQTSAGRPCTCGHSQIGRHRPGPWWLACADSVVGKCAFCAPIPRARCRFVHCAREAPFTG